MEAEKGGETETAEPPPQMDGHYRAQTASSAVTFTFTFTSQSPQQLAGLDWTAGWAVLCCVVLHSATSQ